MFSCGYQWPISASWSIKPLAVGYARLNFKQYGPAKRFVTR
ncbi:MAG: DUF3575 domain-containing protein [Butyricimonas paravirosa]